MSRQPLFVNDPPSRAWAFWLPLAAMLLVEIVRALLVDRFYAISLTAHRIYGLMALKHDGLFVGAFVLLHVAGWSLARRPLSTGLRLLAAAVLALCAVDLFVFAQFSERLSINNFALIGRETATIFGIAGRFAVDPGNLAVTAALALTALSFVAAWPAARPLRARRAVAGAVAGALLIGISAWPDRSTYVNEWAYLNLAETEAMSGVRTPYGQPAIDAAKAEAEARDAARSCVAGRQRRRNVILVLMESLSAHHSRYLSGLADWTPQIDALAREHHVFTDFYANGNNTADGYVATLTGHDPLTAVNGRLFRRWYGVADALPFRLQPAGYRSAFLTSGNLAFLHSGEWLATLGFADIEGHDAAFYNGMERYNFMAAPDAALYDRSLQWMETAKDPYFLVVMTTSTHQPYVDPATHERSEAAVFRYADAAFGKYVRDLAARGWFARGGVLLLTGDHHDMVTIGAEEIGRYGTAADARVPLLVIGDDLPLPQRIDAPFQQADLPPSIEYLATARACFGTRQRNLFAPSDAAPRCILHMRGDRQDVVDAFCGERFARIRLDGEATRLVEGTLPDAPALIREINAERIGWYRRREPDGRFARRLPPAAP
jgi:hypothetical protein